MGPCPYRNKKKKKTKSWTTIIRVVCKVVVIKIGSKDSIFLSGTENGDLSAIRRRFQSFTNPCEAKTPNRLQHLLSGNP